MYYTCVSQRECAIVTFSNDRTTDTLSDNRCIAREKNCTITYAHRQMYSWKVHLIVFRCGLQRGVCLKKIYMMRTCVTCMVGEGVKSILRIFIL